MASEGAAADGKSEAAATSALAAASDKVLEQLAELKQDLQASQAEREVLNQAVRDAEREREELRAELVKAISPSGEPAREFRTVTRTRMRAAPTTEAEEVAVIAQGARLQVIETVEDGTWHEVRLLGYAFHELLEPVRKE